MRPGSVETQKNSESSKIGLSRRALRRFLGAGNGNPTQEYFDLKFSHSLAVCRT